MAVIAVSRQYYSSGDEICTLLPEKSGYKVYTRKDIEHLIVKNGFSVKNFSKFNDKSLNVFLKFSRGKDEYLENLKLVLFECASENNCIIVGRGATSLLREISNVVSIRFTSPFEHRAERLQLNEKCENIIAKRNVFKEDRKQANFYKTYFKTKVSDSSCYDFTVSTEKFSKDAIADAVLSLVGKTITSDKEEEGNIELDKLLICQRIVNVLLSVYDINITNLKATLGGRTITLHGIADSSAIVDRALTMAALELPEYKFESDVTVVQDSIPFRR